MLNTAIKVKFKLIGWLCIAMISIAVFSTQPNLIEKFYSEGSYRLVCFILHPVFNLFPVSVGDVLYVSVTALFVYKAALFFKWLLKKAFKQCALLLLNLVIDLQGVIIIFYLFWGLNYYRPPAAQLLKLNNLHFTTLQLAKVTALLIDSANSIRSRLSFKELRPSNESIYRIATQSIKTLSASSPVFKINKPAIKPSALAPLLNYMSTSGYYNPFTGEAQINYEIPVFNRPVTACHELAHQMGFATEDEADFVGFLACIRSNNNFFKYSAYQLAVGEFMHALYLRDSLANKALKLKISAPVHQDFKIEQEYWLYYENKAGEITSIFYNNFLKANNQPKGLDTYNDMVLLIMGLYNKEGLI